LLSVAIYLLYSKSHYAECRHAVCRGAIQGGASWAKMMSPGANGIKIPW